VFYNRPKENGKAKKILCISKVFYFLFAVYVLLGCLFKPFYNWDVIGYIGAAKSFEQHDPKAIHSFTFEQLRISVSEAKYNELTAKDYYRKTISLDPTAFAEQLPFYQIRPVYTACIYLLYKAGINIVYATHLISGVAVFIGTMFLYYMCKDFLAKPFVYILPPIAIIFGLSDLVKLSTPDGIAFLASIISAYFFMKKRFTILLLFLPILIAIRTDLILFTLPLQIYLGFSAKCKKGLVLLSALASFFVFKGILAYWSNPGWAVTFYSTFVGKITHPISAPSVLTAYEYLHGLFHGIRWMLMNKEFLLYSLVVGYSLYLFSIKAKATSVVSVISLQNVALIFISLFYVCSHFILLPTLEFRYYTAQYILGTFALFSMITEINLLKQSSSN
jgi:hypothetical protein